MPRCSVDLNNLTEVATGVRDQVVEDAGVDRVVRHPVGRSGGQLENHVVLAAVDNRVVQHRAVLARLEIEPSSDSDHNVVDGFRTNGCIVVGIDIAGWSAAVAHRNGARIGVDILEDVAVEERVGRATLQLHRAITV